MAGWAYKQDGGKITRNQECIGFKSKDSSELFALKRTLLNPHKLA